MAIEYYLWAEHVGSCTNLMNMITQTYEER